MKRLPAFLTAFFMLVSFWSQATDIYVSPTQGSDDNDGTKQHPLSTVHAALKKARELRRLNDPSISTGIHIILMKGIFRLQQTIEIRAEDSGTATSPTFIETEAGEQSILSGGISITGWKQTKDAIANLPAIAKGKLWVADVPLVNGRLFEFRQLWVNGRKATRAKSSNGDSMQRILAWNKNDESCWIPTPAFSNLENTSNIEMFIHQWWAIAILRIRKMEKHGDSTKLFFQQPESKIQNDHPWPAPWISKETGNSAFYLTNALQFLDEPGEWWLDVVNRKVYYWPLPNENPASAVFEAPYLETLVKIEGSPDRPISHIYCKGISFQYSTWLRPSQQGHVPHQDGMYMTEAYKLKPAGTKEKPSLDNQAWIGRPAAAVKVSFANNTAFTNCRFEHTASTGLDYETGVHSNIVEGNLFKDIGGTAILAGLYSKEAQEIHLTYHPEDEREVCDSMIIRNNLVTDATNEDWGCVGIGIGYSKNTRIEHNEIENVSYTGISMGWGWSAAENPMRNNRIIANKIHHYGKHNYDCAGIYTLSAQPGSVISENYVDSIYKAPYAHLPSHWFYLYTDEGSSYITVKDNWTPSEKFLQNANGPGNTWSNNGPQVNEAIKNNAGLENAYRWLLTERTSSTIRQPINEEHSEVIELVLKPGTSIDRQKLNQLLHQNRIDTNAVYRWQQHYVIFSKVQDAGVLQNKLQNRFPEAEVKLYPDLFYEFSKKKHCADKQVAQQWDHILLTANMVADPKLQKEYLHYHATQFEKWPEVSQGFCNANFQQLLLYRNGRQLMLVISIPRGESLDKLNPKTTENNPKMDEWNKQMQKYQEGIEGTKKGEVWVMFNKD